MSIAHELETQRNSRGKGLPSLRAINMVNSIKAFTMGKGEVRKDRTIFLGLEWEVQLKRNDSIVKADGKGLTVFGEYIAKSLDSEIKDYVNYRPEGGLLEMVTVPATLEGHKEYMNRLLFVPELLGLIAHHSPRNGVGIHIHICKAAFSKWSLARFIQFIRNVETQDFMVQIAGRDIYYDGTKVSKPVRVQSDLVDSHSKGKFEAVNTSTHQHTVEVRIFDSAYDAGGVYEKLEFCDALTRYTRNPKRAIDATEFSLYVEANKERYPYLFRSNAVQKQLSATKKVIAAAKSVLKKVVA
jgi:hypothetical protein